MAPQTPQKTVVVGAGPVGALAALYAARRGDQVDIYELRGDLRDPTTIPLNFTKSINLALSERGINSVKMAKCPGLLDSILKETIPMHGRMIHGEKGGDLYEESQLYDVHGRFIRAVDRAGLNKRLLDELEKMPNAALHFNHKLVGADFKRNLAWFEKHAPSSTDQANPSPGGDSTKPSEEVEVSFDFMIGADGAHSAVRYHLMKFTRMTYQQEYIDTLWCEFHMPPSATGDFQISPNHLHIWPGGQFMFIGIPSLDKSFTCTLFLPESRFEQLDQNRESLIPFFQKNFPGVIPDLISEDDIRKQYNENPHLPLISIKCTPYHFGSSIVILGDAAHAMVPFYGQGMNAGLEDVRVLYDILDEYGSQGMRDARMDPRAEALKEYTRQRHPDAAAINDLALRNYQEMRSDVRSPIYLLRKYVEERLNAHFPSLGWATQYSRVSFENVRYSEVVRAAKRQGNILLGIMGATPVLITLFTWAGWWWWRWRNASNGGRFLTRWLAKLGRKSEELGRRFI